MLQLFPEPALPRDRWLRVDEAMREPLRWFQVALAKAENRNLAILRNGKCPMVFKRKRPPNGGRFASRQAPR
jgi:hypothetical protein